MAPYVEHERERDERRPLKECPNHLDPLAKVVRHVPKPIPSLFLTPYVEREREHDERRPLKECPNCLDPLAKVVRHVPKPIPSLFFNPRGLERTGRKHANQLSRQSPENRKDIDRGVHSTPMSKYCL